MDTDRDSAMEMASAGDSDKLVEVHDEGRRQHHKTRDRWEKGKEEWRGRRHREAGIIVTDGRIQQSTKLSVMRSQCPGGYLSPSRVDSEQGEKKQEFEEAR